MSVDTYLERKNLSAYRTATYKDIRILVSDKLLSWAAALRINSQRFLLWESLKIEIAPIHQHAAGVA